MTFDELVRSIEQIGVDSRRVVSLSEEGDATSPSPEVGYNITRQPDGVRILSGVGRGKLSTSPYEGFTFDDVSGACDYVWRMVRAEAAPELLSESERRQNAVEAEEILGRD